MKLLSTIASADPLPTTTWLGIIKKNIDAAAIAAPMFIIMNSIIKFLTLLLTLLFDII
jgi:hypothetical protein